MKRVTPLRAIRLKCLYCSNNNREEIKNCIIPECSLYPFRLGKGVKRKRPSKLKAIRKYCYGCEEGTWLGIKNCELTDCALYQYRFGKKAGLALNPPVLKGRNKKTQKEGSGYGLSGFISQNPIILRQNSDKKGVVEAYVVDRPRGRGTGRFLENIPIPVS